MNCKNCNNLLDEHNDYCARCGARIIRNRLTFRNLTAHFSEQFLNYDNKFLQTFLHLFSRPEEVIGSYIEGTRKKYVNAISYFAIAITISGLQLYLMNKFLPNTMDLTSISMTKEAQEIQQQNLGFIQEYQSLLMMLYIPVFALVSKLVFLNIRRYNYTEHLVILMYVFAQLSIVGAIVMIVIASLFDLTLGVISMGSIPIYIIYGSYCYYRLYKISSFGFVLKIVFFLFLLLVGLILFSITYIGIMVYNAGGFEAFTEAQNAASTG